MGFLIDTNILSELRKGKKADAGVRQWYAQTDGNELYVSVLTFNAIKLRKMSFKNKASSFAYGNSIVCWLTIFCEMDFDLHVAETD